MVRDDYTLSLINIRVNVQDDDSAVARHRVLNPRFRPDFELSQ
jgi:hypothetical protein